GRGRGRAPEGLGPLRKGRRGEGPGRGKRGRGRGGAPQDNVERPRTDEQATSAEGREQPPVEPEVPITPEAVVDAPDTTTPKTQHEDPTKLEQSGDESAEKTDN